MTLREVFESMNLTAYDLTVDMLDVHAVSHHYLLYILYVNCNIYNKNSIWLTDWNTFHRLITSIVQFVLF